MKAKSVTIDDVMSWSPCYDREWVKKRFGRKRKLTAVDILNLRTVNAEDKLWAVLRPELINEKTIHIFSCACAEWALNSEQKTGREPDPRSWGAIDAKRRWLRGEINDEDLAAARAAAWDAAWAAARAAARAAAWDAAWAAVRAAARDAAWDAARAAARVAARKWQVKCLKKLLS